MTKITASLLNDTLNVIALARETALAQGGRDQAARLTPVVNGLRTVATAARQPQVAAPAAPAKPAGLLAQDDFKTLLSAAQKAPLNTTPAASAQDRSQVAAAMAAGGMGELDIARQLGVTREEVRLMQSTYSSPSPASVKSYWR